MKGQREICLRVFKGALTKLFVADVSYGCINIKCIENAL